MTFKKNVICTFYIAKKCIRKGQQNCSFWLHEELLSPQKEHIFLEKNVICTFCLANCIRTGQQNCSFWLHEEWLSPQKEQFFCSFLNVIFLEKNVICTFCLAKCIRKGKQILLTTCRMALSTNRAIFCSFLNVTFLENNVICTFCLAKCIRKGQQNCSFWLHDGQKERYLYFLFSRKMTFRKEQKSALFVERAILHVVKRIFCCPFLMRLARQKLQMTFFSRKMTFRKEQKIALFVVRAILHVVKRNNLLSFSDAFGKAKNTNDVLF